MIINFERNVYETIWTGGVDKILSYDTDKLEFTVQDVLTGKIRKHCTNLELNRLSSSPKPFSHEGKDEIADYVSSLNITKVKHNLRKRTEIMFAVTEEEGKVLVVLVDKNYFDTKNIVKDPYDLFSEYTDEICKKFNLDMGEDDCLYVVKGGLSIPSVISELISFGLYENTELLNLI